MAITIEWQDPQETILLETWPAKWELDDYYLMVDEAARILATKDHTVHIICDFSGSRATPRDLAAGARYAEKKTPPNQGTVVFVKPGALINVYMSVARKLNFKAARDLHSADSVDEAVRIIEAETTRI